MRAPWRAVTTVTSPEPSPVPASQGTVVCSVMVVPTVPMGGTSYRAPAGPMASPVMGRGSLLVVTVVGVLVKEVCAILTMTVIMGRMRVLHTADLSVQISHPRVGFSTAVTMVAVYIVSCSVVPVPSPCVTTLLT